jgi:pyruvate dehydrogenase E2 component (dihydrolipoamide acetyltransferase)
MPIQILMPALSPTMTEGKLAKWLKKEGDKVGPGDVIAEIETDKATMEVEAVDEGILGRILVAAGTEGVKVNQPIAILLGEGEDGSALAGSAAPAAATPPPKPASSAPTPSAATQPARSPPAPAPASDGADRIVASPLAKRMAKQAGLDLARVKGSGPHGRIVKADIEAALGGAPMKEAPPPRRGVADGSLPWPWRRPDKLYEDQPLSSVRKVIATRLTAAHQQIPVFYLTVDCEIDRLLAARQEINESAPKDKKSGEPAYKVSVNDLVVKAAALALRKVPAVNASWLGEAIRVFHTVDVAVAVAYEGGLITPIVRDADLKGVAQISIEMKELAGRARVGRLKPEEYQGGGFSVSNLGMHNIRQFTSIINPPQACILAVGAGEQRPLVRAGKLEIATLMSVTLTCDHRVVDGALGAQWLQAFKRFIEAPATMLA